MKRLRVAAIAVTVAVALVGSAAVAARHGYATAASAPAVSASPTATSPARSAATNPLLPESSPSRPGARSVAAGGGPLVLAHRGGVERTHENTMASFDDAIAIRADYIETDVRHSADGVAFLLHDPTLARACAPYTGQAIRSLTAAQVAQVRCAGQPIPRLSELVARLQHPDAARVYVMPEVKDVDPLGVRDALAPLGWQRVLVQSFNLAALRQIEQTTPEVRTCPLIWGADALDGALAVTHDCVGADFHAIDAAFVVKAHAAGAVVYAFTVNDPAVMRNLAVLGTDGIITNRPRLARATFAS